MSKRKRGDFGTTNLDESDQYRNGSASDGSLVKQQRKSAIPGLISEKQISRTADQAVRIKLSRLRAKLLQAHAQLVAAIKLARGFERQKLGRRQKQASEARDGQKLGRLREEVVLVRELDPGEVAGVYLVRIMERRKAVRESSVWREAVGRRTKTSEGETDGVREKKGSVEADVLARLWKSAPVTQAVPGIVDGILSVLGLIEDQDGRTRRKNRTVSEKSSDEQETYSGRIQKGVPTADNDVFEGFSDGEPVATEQGLDDDERLESELDDATLDALEDRLAASSDESEDDSDVSEQSGSQDSRDPMELAPPDSDDSELDDDQEEEEPQSDSQNGAVNPTTRSEQTAKPKPVPPLRPTSSAFLPSLSMMGGYYSGSESGSETNEPPSSAIPLPRKNRRGQRERQKIAEKKFGSKAKHLQKQQNPRQDQRDTGWDARRGAVNSSKPIDRWQRGGQNEAQHASGQGSSSSGKVGAGRVHGNSAPINTALHPSWEAARKKKMENQNQMAAFSGKKITFD